MAACVEMSHDENGIIWPAALAPYHVVLTIMDASSERQQAEAKRLSKSLSERGLDVLVDDRDERPGVKFKDADLIGVPVRLVLGDKALDAGGVEFKLRKDTQSKGSVVALADVERTVLQAING
jgi:prolyl-tRNA synthetase